MVVTDSTVTGERRKRRGAVPASKPVKVCLNRNKRTTSAYERGGEGVGWGSLVHEEVWVRDQHTIRSGKG